MKKTRSGYAAAKRSEKKAPSSAPDTRHPKPDTRFPPAFTSGFQRILRWFNGSAWKPFSFQLETWSAYLEGKSGLVHAPTGSGKTLSVFLGPVMEYLSSGQQTPKRLNHPFTVVWITPMRALANDTAHSLASAVKELELNWSVELRTSDTTSYRRKKQRERLPTVLVTTPESLSILISYPDSRERMNSLKCAVVDEWHELLSTKRGTQTELGLARLKAWNPDIRIWGLSATLGNLEEAKDALLGTSVFCSGGCPQPLDPGSPVEEAAGDDSTKPVEVSRCHRKSDDRSVLIHSNIAKTVQVQTIPPMTIEKFPWAGHLGLKMAPRVIDAIESGNGTLVFTNTRSFAEFWFRELISLKPDWLGKIGIHHGSLDRAVRVKVEHLLRSGQLKAVVCTSSLDLGVDFPAVDQVLQIGSPKGIGRLMQRAGRSGHSPGRVSKVLCVPTHAFELVEFSAAREGIEKRAVESRRPLDRPLDVLVQHVVTVAAGGGFDEKALLAEVRSTHAYRNLSDEEWGWVIDFVSRGGPTLTAYPRFQRIKSENSQWQIASDSTAKLHRLGIGTITGEGTMNLVMAGGKKLGTIEENFIAKMHPGDQFTFGGRQLELISTHQMTAKVRPAKVRRPTVPQWMGGRFPLSTMLSVAVRRRLDEARRDIFNDDEMRLIAPLLQLQNRWSKLPAMNQLLIESHSSREGAMHYLFPFLGRLVHEGLSALIIYRLKRMRDIPSSASFTDYGIELLTPDRDAITARDWQQLLSSENLVEDLLNCLNSGELARRQFRDISRIAGLIMPTVPGMARTSKQLQASAELFYDVFQEFDPDNLLLTQARREVLEQQLEVNRLKEALAHLGTQDLLLVNPPRLTPLAFPLWAQRIGSQTVKLESAKDRIERMVKQLEAAAMSE